MGQRDYERLDIETFGAHLLHSGDLDPVYIALTKMETDLNWSRAELKRWLVAYWCLYHCGAACHISCFEGAEFWAELHKAAANEELAPNGLRWPRGHERRHFRGQAAIKAVASYASRFSQPEEMVDFVAQDGGEFWKLSKRAQELALFGPWMSFKIGDMVDRVLGVPVDFSQGAVFMFKDPVKAALMVYKRKLGWGDEVVVKDEKKAIQEVVDYLTNFFSGRTAPPLHDRPVGLQEVETVLCKWKSHLNGHYPLFNDIVEIKDGLQPWLFNYPAHDTVERFLQSMPQGPEQ